MSGTSDILGHRGTIERLWSVLDRGQLHHAYLFEGPRGVGKHTLALRLAMAANCTGSTQGPRPCGVCATCRHVQAGTHPDVMRLAPSADRASGTIAVDEVREVVRAAGYHRYESRHRFVIVDPAEAMLPAAANALLKTLEEPPAGTCFLLVSHNASVLLPTILSRCQRVRIGIVPEAELVPWLAAKGHAGIAEACARLAEGCPGRALSLAEGGLEERLQLRDRLMATLAGRLADVFAWSTDLTSGKRQDWRQEVEAVLEIVEDLLRDVVILGSGSAAPLANADVPEVVERWTRALWPGGVVTCQRALDDLRADLEVNVTGKTALDAMLTRLATELGPYRRPEA